MTDGIIQQVFKPYSVMNENIVWLLDRIEQELIEKIKQDVDTNRSTITQLESKDAEYYDGKDIALQEFRNRLIGDSQE